MAGVERAWYPIQNLRQGTPLPAFLNFGVWPGQKRPGPEIFIRFSLTRGRSAAAAVQAEGAS